MDGDARLFYCFDNMGVPLGSLFAALHNILRVCLVQIAEVPSLSSTGISTPGMRSGY
jgi:hypothetical protein